MRLSAQFYTMGQDQNLFSGLRDVSSCDFRKNNRFTTAGWQLVQEVVPDRMVLEPLENFFNSFFLISIQLLTEVLFGCFYRFLALQNEGNRAF